MNKKTYQKLVDKIIESNPSIMELERGCKMSNKHQEDDNPFKIKTFNRKTTFRNKKVYECIEHSGRISCFPPDALKIIGRDITVLDIMKTLGGCYAVDGKGALFELQEVEGKTAKWIYKLLPCTFDFNKPLQDQSDQTKMFLFNLLK